MEAFGCVNKVVWIPATIYCDAREELNVSPGSMNSTEILPNHNCSIMTFSCFSGSSLKPIFKSLLDLVKSPSSIPFSTGAHQLIWEVDKQKRWVHSVSAISLLQLVFRDYISTPIVLFQSFVDFIWGEKADKIISISSCHFKRNAELNVDLSIFS